LGTAFGLASAFCAEVAGVQRSPRFSCLGGRDRGCCFPRGRCERFSAISSSQRTTMKIALRRQVLRLDGKENRPPNGPGRRHPMDRSELVRSFAKSCTEKPKNHEDPRRMLTRQAITRREAGASARSMSRLAHSRCCDLSIRSSWFFVVLRVLRAKSVGSPYTGLAERVPRKGPGPREAPQRRIIFCNRGPGAAGWLALRKKRSRRAHGNLLRLSAGSGRMSGSVPAR
jgi:hypothetical protein